MHQNSAALQRLAVQPFMDTTLTPPGVLTVGDVMHAQQDIQSGKRTLVELDRFAISEDSLTDAAAAAHTAEHEAHS